jgi:transketolase
MVHAQSIADTPGAGHDYSHLRTFMSRMTGDEKHSEAATSTLDVIWTLHDRVMRFDPSRPDHPGRDRFVLSKGHGPMAYYAVLAAKGFIPPNALDEFGAFESMLGHHPDRRLVPGVEVSTGSLGHGLPTAVGMALGLRIHRSPSRVFCLLGDGELDEGSVHEAIAMAGRSVLDNLTAIVIDNDSALHGWPGGIGSRFSVEGWETVDVDGRDHEAIEAGLRRPHPDVPLAVIATVGRRDG